MSFKVIILAPPTHFPVGFSEFIETYPEAQIEIYHPDYQDLGKYFFARLIKDLLLEFRQVSVIAQLEPLDSSCDLYLEVAEVDRPPEEEQKFPLNIWPRSRGSLDLRCFLELSTRGQDELWEIQKSHNAVAPFQPPRVSDEPLGLLREVTGFLMGERELSLEAMKILDVTTQPEALEWLQQFCRDHQLKENLVRLNRLLKSKCSWSQIQARMRK